MGRDYMIIVAAGSGSRYGGDLPKQFCNLDGRPLLMITMERLRECAPDAALIVVLSDDMRTLWDTMCTAHRFTVPHTVVSGGKTRAHSVRNAIMTIDPLTVGWIGVHDAARPIVTSDMFGRLIDALRYHTGAIPVVKVTDSLRKEYPDGTSESVDRSIYRAVQTPQIFHGPQLIDANRGEILPGFTDDASVMESHGFTDLALVEGDTRNIKVTNPGDMVIAAMYLEQTGTRSHRQAP